VLHVAGGAIERDQRARLERGKAADFGSARIYQRYPDGARVQE